MTPIDRAKAERTARMLLIVPVVPILPAGAYLVWALGYRAHPHKLALAYIIAGVFVVVTTATQLYLYRIRMRQLRGRP